MAAACRDDLRKRMCGLLARSGMGITVGETYDLEYRAETAASLVRIRATATWPVVLALKFVEAE